MNSVIETGCSLLSIRIFITLIIIINELKEATLALNTEVLVMAIDSILQFYYRHITDNLIKNDHANRDHDHVNDFKSLSRNIGCACKAQTDNWSCTFRNNSSRKGLPPSQVRACADPSLTIERT